MVQGREGFGKVEAFCGTARGYIGVLKGGFEGLTRRRILGVFLENSEGIVQRNSYNVAMWEFPEAGEPQNTAILFL